MLLVQIFLRLLLKEIKLFMKINNQNIKFIVDNILDSDFKDNYFDYIFDRGCFHVFSRRR